MLAIGIPERRAFKWMTAAHNMFQGVLHPRNEPILLPLEHGGRQVCLSEALMLTDDGSESPALDFQRAVFAILANYSLSDAINNSFDYKPTEGSVSRIANGLMARQTNGPERRDYPAFIKRKLKEMTEHLVVKGTRRTLARERAIDPDQKARIAAAFTAAVSVWPRWVLELLHSAIGTQLKLSDIERVDHLQEAARGNFVGWKPDYCAERRDGGEAALARAGHWGVMTPNAQAVSPFFVQLR